MFFLNNKQLLKPHTLPVNSRVSVLLYSSSKIIKKFNCKEKGLCKLSTW